MLNTLALSYLFCFDVLQFLKIVVLKQTNNCCLDNIRFKDNYNSAQLLEHMPQGFSRGRFCAIKEMVSIFRSVCIIRFSI